MNREKERERERERLDKKNGVCARGDALLYKKKIKKKRCIHYVNCRLLPDEMMPPKPDMARDNKVIHIPKRCIVYSNPSS